MGHRNQRTAGQQANGYPANLIDPVLVNGILHEKTDPEHQNSDTDLVSQIFTDKFFKIRITFEEIWFTLYRYWFYRLLSFRLCNFFRLRNSCE